MASSKIGRNDPCPCGNNKKYKFCHGKTSADKEQLSTAHTEQLSTAHSYLGNIPVGTTKEIPMTMFPGEEGRLSLVPDNIPGAGAPGLYRSTFLLSRPGQVTNEERRFDFSDAMPGDSHLAIAAPAFVHEAFPDVASIKLETGTEDLTLTFNGRPNAKGYLGKIESDPFPALSFEDAESKAYHLLVKVLSAIAIGLDIPIQISQQFVVEQSTGAVTSRINVPPLETPLALRLESKLGVELSYYSSLYREALNSNSVVYRYLCFYKILEAIRSRRKRITQEALKNGQQAIRRFECFPDDLSASTEWLKPIYGRELKGQAISQIFRSEVIGKKFNRVIDTYLIPLRNTVAHGIMDSGELGMSSDDLLKLDKINYWLPATRVMVRRMLRNEFPQEFLANLPETGDVQG
jgi:hypothetical protein